MAFLQNNQKSSQVTAHPLISNTLGSGPFVLAKSQPTTNTPLRSPASWKSNQYASYIIFLDFCLATGTLLTENRKEEWRFYEAMGDFVVTRNPNQCRMHHKKQLHETGTVNLVVEKGRESIKGYELLFDAQKNRLEELFGKHQSKISGNMQAIWEKKGAEGAKAEVPSRSQDEMGEGKKDDVPTGTEYPTDEPTFQQKKVRPSFTLQGFSQSGFNCLGAGFKPMTSFLHTQKEVKVDHNRESEWLECHQAFLNWTSKLNKLLGRFGGSY